MKKVYKLDIYIDVNIKTGGEIDADQFDIFLKELENEKKFIVFGNAIIQKDKIKIIEKVILYKD